MCKGLLQAVARASLAIYSAISGDLHHRRDVSFVEFLGEWGCWARVREYV